MPPPFLFCKEREENAENTSSPSRHPPYALARAALPAVELASLLLLVYPDIGHDVALAREELAPRSRVHLHELGLVVDDPNLQNAFAVVKLVDRHELVRIVPARIRLLLLWLAVCTVGRRKHGPNVKALEGFTLSGVAFIGKINYLHVRNSQDTSGTPLDFGLLAGLWPVGKLETEQQRFLALLERERQGPRRPALESSSHKCLGRVAKALGRALAFPDVYLKQTFLVDSI